MKHSFASPSLLWTCLYNFHQQQKSSWIGTITQNQGAISYNCWWGTKKTRHPQDWPLWNRHGNPTKHQCHCNIDLYAEKKGFWRVMHFELPSLKPITSYLPVIKQHNGCQRTHIVSLQTSTFPKLHKHWCYFIALLCYNTFFETRWRGILYLSSSTPVLDFVVSFTLQGILSLKGAWTDVW